MLMLHRMVDPFEVRKCDISGEMIVYGDFYYEDTEDGVTVKATEYKKLKDEMINNRFDRTLLNKAQSDAEYKQMLKKAEQEFLKSTILDRPIMKNGQVINNYEE